MSMHLQGIDFIALESTKPYFQAKMVFNANGAIFFPVNQEHRTQSGPDIRYADNYKGNALAAMLSPGRIEVRFHQSFADQQVAQILRVLRSSPALQCLQGYQASYQGRALSL